MREVCDRQCPAWWPPGPPAPRPGLCTRRPGGQQNSEICQVRPTTSHPSVVLRHAAQHQLGHALSQTSRGRLNTIRSVLSLPSLPSSVLTSDPAIFRPFLYQEVVGVGLPVAEQVRVTAPETRPITREGGRSLNRTNLSPP